jgi:ABC-type branched-subunit amino acid transport system ATPase component
MRRINQQGLTVRLMEQKVGFALKVSHRGCALDSGRIKMSAGGRGLLREDYLRRAYLAV